MCMAPKDSESLESINLNFGSKWDLKYGLCNDCLNESLLFNVANFTKLERFKMKLKYHKTIWISKIMKMLLNW